MDKCDSIIPFSFDKNLLVNVTQKHMVSGAFTPDDLLDVAVITKQLFHYIPVYLMSGSYEAEWDASFGYDRKEHYTVYERQEVGFVNNKTVYQQVPVTKTKTVTDWHPMQGTDSGTFEDIYVYAGKMLPEDVQEFFLEDNTEYQSEEVTDFEQKYVVGCDVEPISVSENAAYENVAKASIEEIIKKGVKSHGQGDRQKDWHWSYSIDKETTTILLPIAQSVFEYKGKEYHLWVVGYDPSKMHGDNLPVDKNKLIAALLGYIPVGVAVVALLVAEHYGATPGWFAFISLLISGGYGAKRHFDMVTYSKTIRNTLLGKIQASSSSTENMPDEDKAKLVSTYTKPVLSPFADTSKDQTLLPSLSVVCALLMLMPIFISGIKSSPSEAQQSRHDNSTTRKTTPLEVQQSQLDNSAAQPSSPSAVQQSQSDNSAAQEPNDPLTDQANELIRKAQKAYNEKEYAEALAMMEQAHALLPNDQNINDNIEDIKSKM